MAEDYGDALDYFDALKRLEEDRARWSRKTGDGGDAIEKEKLLGWLETELSRLLEHVRSLRREGRSG